MAKPEYAIFLWVVNDFKQGNVLSLNNIIAPRKEFSAYQVGERVKAKCPGHGNQDAIIARIGAASQKAKWSKEMDTPEGFQSIIADLDLHPVEQKTPQQQNQGKKLHEPETEEEPLPTISLKKKKQVKRKLDVGANEKDVEPAPKQKKNTDSSRPSEKQLQAAAEEMALTELAPCTSQFSPTRVVMESLHLLNAESPALQAQSPDLQAPLMISPRRSPRWHPTRVEAEELKSQNERLRERVSNLETQVSSLQFHQNNLWAEYERLSYTVGTMRQPESWASQNSTALCTATSSADQYSVTAASSATSPSTSSQPTANEILAEPTEMADRQTVVLNENEKTYCGFTKNQLTEIAKNQTNYKKASAKLFRLLFTKQEMEGRSLTGRPSAGKQARPALEDQWKLEIIYGIINSVFRTDREFVNIVLRDILKPCRVKK